MNIIFDISIDISKINLSFYTSGKVQSSYMATYHMTTKTHTGCSLHFMDVLITSIDISTKYFVYNIPCMINISGISINKRIANI